MDDNSANNAAQPADNQANSGNANTPASNVPSGEAAPADPDNPATSGAADPNSADAAAPNDGDDEGQPRFRDRSAARRIGGLTREVREREREIGRLRGIMEARGISLDADNAQHAPASDNSRPRQDQFRSFEEYTEAVSRWAARDEHARLNRDTSQKSVQKNVQESMKAARAEYTDYDAVVAEVFDNSFPNTPTMAEYVGESEQAGRVLYWLGTHPDEALRISQLSPVGQAKALAKVEAGLGSPKPSPQRPGAPPPPKTVNGSGAAEKDPGKMSMDEYARHRGFA